METKAIILCAGEATRWNNYKDTQKHLIEINGERILDRTTRLLEVYGIKDISVVTKEYNHRYETSHSKVVPVKVNYEKNADADKFLSSKELWNKNGRTIVIYGDCYFSEEAMKTIVGFKSKDWTIFCRPNASKITGTPWGECFAQSFYPKDLERHEQALHEIAQKKKSGKIKRCGGWEHYRTMVGIDPNKHKMTTNYVKIDDFTDDFDYPEDLDRWLLNYNN